MKQGLISVIIPVYNVAPYLREALDSVVNQTYRDLEIIVVDDGSTDGSGEICDEYSCDPRITVIHQKNGGLSNARNTGLDHATGSYIAFLDSDDAWHSSFIERLLSAIANVDIVVCRYAILKTGGMHSSHGGKGTKGAQPRAKEGTYSREDSLRMVVNGEINWAVWNKLYRAKLWKTTRFADGLNFEDVDVTYRVMDLATCVKVIEPVLYFMHLRSDSITQTANWKNIDDQKKALSHLEGIVRYNTPAIFREKDVQRVRIARLKSMIRGYAHGGLGEDLRKEIIATRDQIGLKNCNFRCRVAFFMVKHCPWLLKGAYSVYYPLRLLVMKVVGK